MLKILKIISLIYACDSYANLVTDSVHGISLNTDIRLSNDYLFRVNLFNTINSFNLHPKFKIYFEPSYASVAIKKENETFRVSSNFAVTGTTFVLAYILGNESLYDGLIIIPVLGFLIFQAIPNSSIGIPVVTNKIQLFYGNNTDYYFFSNSKHWIYYENRIGMMVNIWNFIFKVYASKPLLGDNTDALFGTTIGIGKINKNTEKIQ